MKRRTFIALLGGAAASSAARPLTARAQQPAKLPTIGFLGESTPSVQSQRTAAFVQRLRELGWIEGRTVAIEYRWAESRTERLAEIAVEFVRLKVDVSPHCAVRLPHLLTTGYGTPKTPEIGVVLSVLPLVATDPTVTFTDVGARSSTRRFAGAAAAQPV
jgi:hypothetical protein